VEGGQVINVLTWRRAMIYERSRSWRMNDTTLSLTKDRIKVLKCEFCNLLTRGRSVVEWGTVANRVGPSLEWLHVEAGAIRGRIEGDHI